MFKNKKIVVVMPAYNAAKTLRKTYDEVMSQGIVDLVIPAMASMIGNDLYPCVLGSRILAGGIRADGGAG
jgi:hypothetical protein